MSPIVWDRYDADSGVLHMAAGTQEMVCRVVVRVQRRRGSPRERVRWRCADVEITSSGQ